MLLMKIAPDEQEINCAVDLLVNRYNISAQLLGKLFDLRHKNQANQLLKKLTGDNLDRVSLARLLIFKEGPTLFTGSDLETIKLRKRLLDALNSDSIIELFDKHIKNGNSTTKANMITKLAERRWDANGKWANDFVSVLEFPRIFAGVQQREQVPTIVDIQPRLKIPKLVDFQKDLKARMLNVLENTGDRTRCIVTLPTGGGKTRVAVEAFIEWMQPRFSMNKYLVWIAQSEELCEQAISCIQAMWGDREFIKDLRIYRYFKGKDINKDDLIGGVVISSINQLYNRIKAQDECLDVILENTGAMIIDEAHRATTPMYNVLFDKAESICGKDLFPVCGLTATPGRTTINNNNDTPKLVKRFEAYLIKPSLGVEYEADPLLFFREQGYLAKANHIVFQSGKDYELTEEQIRQIQKEGDITDKVFLKELANDNDRNLCIIKRLLKIPKGNRALVYACTVDHANFLATLLNASGRSAGVISSDTASSIRRGMIEDFRNGSLDYICNYGVLTTGFDAPKTNYIVLCRPTTSEILYEQIIGRGLRGPIFGGTEYCTIIDFADNIKHLGLPLAYKRFSDFWTSDNIS